METARSDCQLPVSRKITVTGTVQGVGFRPFVYNLARSLRLSGSVSNSGGTVEIMLHGSAGSIERFLDRLRTEQPALAAISTIFVEDATSTGPAGEVPAGGAYAQVANFVILDSGSGSSLTQTAAPLRVPPDTATCPQCLHELFDPANRRFFYPFINCTSCGPRFTIIKRLPYDRATTTMSAFPMCAQCQTEYTDPANRRFHAQPNACFTCGPQIQFLETTELDASCGDSYMRESQSGDRLLATQQALATATRMLRDGKTVAIKGLGGFHLACDATNQDAVALLRRRKQRYAKPFAIMVPKIEQLKGICDLTETELEALVGSRRPIVLLPVHSSQRSLVITRTPECSESRSIAPDVNPGIDRLGVMLPYTPLQALLLEEFGGPLVMTSGNLSAEPICMTNREALMRLRDIADGFILHNRDIETRFDDSVLSVINDKPVLLRRSRGFAPQPISLQQTAGQTVLALGANLKNTFCLTDGSNAYVSQHIGDFGSLETSEFLEETLAKFCQLFQLKPKILACDLHPDYISTRMAERLAGEIGCPLVRVQHHHAHIASCMAENGIDRPVVGIAWDGIGYGADGVLWGAEFMLCDYQGYKRLASFTPLPLPGGEAAIKNPWRMALSCLLQPEIQDQVAVRQMLQRYEDQFSSGTVKVIGRQIARRLNTPMTTSCGRLFDAVSSLLSFCHEARFEGEAAMILESRARQSGSGVPVLTPALPGGSQHRAAGDAFRRPRILTRQAPGRHSATFETNRDLGCLVDTTDLIAQICGACSQNVPPETIALAFHVTLAVVASDICSRVAEQWQTNTVCLSGGVFQNRLLLELLLDRLQARGFEVYSQAILPANDGGLSAGQAMVALAQTGNLHACKTKNFDP